MSFDCEHCISRHSDRRSLQVNHLSTQEFIGIFLGFCCTLFAVISTMKAAQELQQKNYSEAVEDLRRCGFGTIFTFLCMLGAIINLTEFADTMQRKANSALRKKSAELTALKSSINLDEPRWVAVTSEKSQ